LLQTGRHTDGYVYILRPPDPAAAFLENETITLARDGHRWTAKGIAVEAEPRASALPVRIEAPEAALMRVRLRWKANVPERWRILNDQWERSYGDLEFRGLRGGRVLPWYFLDMPGLAAAMKQQGVQPGIWLRAFFTTVEICPPLLTVLCGQPRLAPAQVRPGYLRRQR
jgi:hypothetical protein